MASIDQTTVLKNLNAFTPEVINTDTKTDGLEIDTIGFESITFFMRSTSYADGAFTPLIQGTNTSGTGYVDITNDFLIGTEDGAALDADKVSKIGVVASYRFYKLSFVSTGTTTGSLLDAVAVLGSPRRAAVA
tara:strand:+ start:27 stop:425 length:399 start_codon:yes stop_codon:yes gene_type:complete